MSYKLISAVLFFVLVALALLVFGKHFLFMMDWQLIDKEDSPDGSYTVTQYLSVSEAGHAPYGHNFIIESWKSFPIPKQGETFFAGYCDQKASFEWVGNESITIYCKGEADTVRTKASIVHGIKVDVVQN